MERLKRDMIGLKIKYLEKYGISTEKAIHNGWIEHQNMLERFKDKTDAMLKTLKDLTKSHPMGYFDKWQYIFTSKNGKISLIRLLDYHRIGEHIYEIYCMDEMKKWKDATGNDQETPSTPAKKLLPDIRRFYKREDAIKSVIEILRTDK